MKKVTKRLLCGTLTIPFILTLNSCSKKYKVNYDNNYDQSTVRFSSSYYEETLNDVTNELNEIITTSTTKEDLSTDIALPDIRDNHDIVLCSDDYFQISEDLKESIYKVVNNFGEKNISFSICDLETNNTFCYNTEQTYNAACIVKPSIVIYLCKLAEDGLVDLNDTIKYEGNVISGSGYLNGYYYSGYQAPTGKKFTILELMYHTLYYSDNNAYRLLHHYLVNSEYYEDYCSYMDIIDAASLKANKDIIWVRKAKVNDGVNVIRGLYNFYETSINSIDVRQTFVDGNSLYKISGKERLTYGEIPYYIMGKAKYDYLENETGNYSITKTGFVSGCGNLSCRNLISMSYGERPFFICLLTKGNSEDLRKSTVNKI